ncbi:nucleotide-binding protein [Chitinimonas prasina]|uniref:Nucleotide-binding protein n=1 Tax=Chitinimonas prasina TaxID=1434937 RepID=A0ABQ5YGD6_9NEIS|nr:RNase adapter RapZ [Chitinimonas prasina]GLR14057.1 nucleotide-binding protein [Chitinimonas prasina]
MATVLQIVLISGLSGSGKSVALKLLEDLGYYCIDNLPATLLPQTVRLLQGEGHQRVGISVDIRGAQSLPALPDCVADLKSQGLDVRVLFLEAKTESLLKRFSETRRKHPLSTLHTDYTVAECISLEREILASVADLSHRVDTSELSANALRAWVKQFLALDQSRLTLIFQSFGFKHGLPLDADFVFDARCLPNPYYDPSLRPLTGLDQPVIQFLEAEAAPQAMYTDVLRYLENWLPAFDRDNRSYVTVGIGCTGGQHRSVWLAEKLATHFAQDRQVLVRHRESSPT